MNRQERTPAAGPTTRSQALNAFLVLQCLVAAQLPVLLASKLFLPGLPIPLHRAAIAAAIALVVGLVVSVPGASDRKARARRVAVFTLFVVVILAYPAGARALGVEPYSVSDWWFAWIYLFVAVGLVFVAAHAFREEPVALSLFTAGLVAVSVAGLWMAGLGDYVRGVPDWGVVRGRLAASPSLGSSTPTDPDILHLIFDAFGRPDTLESEYGIEPRRFATLQDAGLNITPGAVANYAYTYQALAAMLNMQYLDPLSGPFAMQQDRRPLVDLVRQSSAVHAMKSRGYEFVLVGSGFDVTPDSPLADQCIECGPTVPGLFETALLSISPLRALGLWRPFFNAHRDRVEAAISRLLEMPPSTARPRLVIAHLLLPHPPFLLGPDGPLPTPNRPFEILDEALYRGSKDEYRRGYSAQALYALQTASAIVAHARASTRRGLVVVVNGDHGPGLQFDSTHPTTQGIRERLTILMASSWPAGSPPADLRSPVNIYRAIFNVAFHAGLPMLEDRSFIPLDQHPYQFREVTADLALSRSSTR